MGADELWNTKSWRLVCCLAEVEYMNVLFFLGVAVYIVTFCYTRIATEPLLLYK